MVWSTSIQLGASAEMKNKNWKLSPSDFAFLWEECKRCFYLKVARNFNRPRSIMPKIFTIIDSQMKNYYSGKRTEEIAEGASPSIVTFSEKWVESKPIEFSGRSITCFVRGKFDTIVKFDDDSYGVVDFKTSQTKSEHIPLYSRQLHAYAHALENPNSGNFSVSPISRLGLLVFEPKKYTQGKTGVVGLAGDVSWIEVPRDDKSFMKFLDGVLDILDSPEPPLHSSECGWCKYREETRLSGL